MLSQHQLEGRQRWYEENAPEEKEKLEIAVWNRQEEAEAAAAGSSCG